MRKMHFDSLVRPVLELPCLRTIFTRKLAHESRLWITGCSVCFLLHAQYSLSYLYIFVFIPNIINHPLLLTILVFSLSVCALNMNWTAIIQLFLVLCWFNSVQFNFRYTQHYIRHKCNYLAQISSMLIQFSSIQFNFRYKQHNIRHKCNYVAQFSSMLIQFNFRYKQHYIRQKCNNLAQFSSMLIQFNSISGIRSTT